MSRGHLRRPGAQPPVRRFIAIAIPTAFPFAFAVGLVPLRGRIPNATIALLLAAIGALVVQRGNSDGRGDRRAVADRAGAALAAQTKPG